MKTFDDLVFQNMKQCRGRIAKMYFFGGYGVSVVCSEFSYGGEEGLYELAVLDGCRGPGSKLCYDTPVTDDVIGWLTERGVTEKMREVQEL